MKCCYLNGSKILAGHNLKLQKPKRRPEKTFCSTLAGTYSQDFNLKRVKDVFKSIGYLEGTNIGTGRDFGTICETKTAGSTKLL